MTRRFSAMVLYPSSAAWSIDTIDPSKKIHELLYKDKAKCQKLKAKHYRIYKKYLGETYSWFELEYVCQKWK